MKDAKTTCIKLHGVIKEIRHGLQCLVSTHSSDVYFVLKFNCLSRLSLLVETDTVINVSVAVGLGF